MVSFAQLQPRLQCHPPSVLSAVCAYLAPAAPELRASFSDLSFRRWSTLEPISPNCSSSSLIAPSLRAQLSTLSQIACPSPRLMHVSLHARMAEFQLHSSRTCARWWSSEADLKTERAAPPQDPPLHPWRMDQNESDWRRLSASLLSTPPDPAPPLFPCLPFPYHTRPEPGPQIIPPRWAFRPSIRISFFFSLPQNCFPKFRLAP